MYSLNNNIVISSAVIGLLTIITGGLIFMVRSKKRRNFEKVAKVLKLIIYPIKSLPGIEVPEFEITKNCVKFGPFRDRSWLLVDGQNRFITQRQNPSLSLLKTSFNENQLWVDGPHLPTLKVDLIYEKQTKDTYIATKVWGQSVEGVYCGEEAEQWFSQYLDKPGIKLIQHMPHLKQRSSAVESNGKVVIQQKFPIIYQDGSPLLLMNKNSIDELNEKLSDVKISEKNFRPNVVVSDCPPLDEDNWLFIKIRDIEFEFLKPCDRCVLTTINPETGIKSNEPLDTLRTYRLADKNMRKIYGTSPLFGVNFAPLSVGTIASGDDILAIRRDN